MEVNLDKNFNRVCYTIRQMQHDDCDDVKKLGMSLGITMQRNANEIMLKYDPLGTFVAQESETGN